MTHPKKIYYPFRKSAQPGFALVVSIVLMAFLLLLCISLSTLIRVEMQTSTQQVKQQLANQNAHFALRLAIGELQQHLGPDQRISAPSSITDSSTTPTTPYWTGVWRQQAGISERAPVLENWLVSGNEVEMTVSPDLSEGNGTGENVILVNNASFDTDEKVIRLPKQAVQTNASGTEGHYAWWVGDEGVKAHIALSDPAVTRPPQERIYSFLSAQRMGIEHIADFGNQLPMASSLTNRILSLQHFPLAAANEGDREALEIATQNLFHDVTTHSHGLLVDTARGGLKKDLTPWLRNSSLGQGPADSDLLIEAVEGDEYALPHWGLLRSYANTPGDLGPIPPHKHSLTDHGVYPVMTFAYMGVNVSNEGHNTPFRVQLFPFFVLWNPFSVPIAAAEYEVGIGISNPTNARIHFYKESNNPQNYLATLHVNRGILTESTTSTEQPRFFRFAIDAPDIPPGASLVFCLADSEYGQEYNRGNNVLVADAVNPTANFVTMTSNNVVTFDDPDEFPDDEEFFVWEKASFNGGRMDASLRLRPTTPDDPTGHSFANDALHEIRNAGFSNQTSRTTPWVDEAMGPAWRMRTEVAMRSGASQYNIPWMALHNLSAPESSRSKRDTSQNTSHIGGVAGDTNWPDSNISTLVGPNSAHNPTPHWRASVGTGLNSTSGIPRDIVLREFMPEEVPLFSIGQLRHANLSLLDIYPSWAIGNSLPNYRIELTETSDAGGSSSLAPMNRVYDVSYLLNETLWDSFFMSTIPEGLDHDDLISGADLPNSRMVFHELDGHPDYSSTTAFDDTAMHLTANGMFNVNSTSVAAWSALLASMNGLDYNPETDSDGLVLQNPFSRYARPIDGPNSVWSQSYRTLTPTQIEALANYIVEEVKERGPFLSLADFINRRLEESRFGFKGTLQAAIDAQSAASPTTGINRFPTSEWPNAVAGSGVTFANYFIPQLQGGSSTLGYAPQAPWNSRYAQAPGYLSQSDLLSSLGAVLTTRSDTFIIRAYGDVANPATDEIEARAHWEAVVQRIPTYVDPTLSPSATPAVGSENERFGRAFRILSIRLLSADEV